MSSDSVSTLRFLPHSPFISALFLFSLFTISFYDFDLCAKRAASFLRCEGFSMKGRVLLLKCNAPLDTGEQPKDLYKRLFLNYTEIVFPYDKNKNRNKLQFLIIPNILKSRGGRCGIMYRINYMKTKFLLCKNHFSCGGMKNKCFIVYT